ncbi:uncharacterized protein LOC119995573 [Tripterygium wilfordii]|uniref:uncharacterized protein LOC119995573 n=1 Tax=Tripterygium wilfordii TaxID=458696 RepID=UPI0018F7ECC3|nr:uncharacterized protein LOC119995573 [Tripterygium wilfordii]
MGLSNTIIEGNTESQQDRAKAMIFLRHHLHEDLKSEYLMVKDPLRLWNNLKERFEHYRTIILPKARYDWMHLRLQDYKTVSEYNSVRHKIVSQLELCGETITEVDKLEKTFSTFHLSDINLQQQYRNRNFTQCSQLISLLLVAEQNNQLLLKNHQSRPTGTTPFPEVNAIVYNNHGRGRGRGGRRGRGRGRHNRGGNYLQPYHQKRYHVETIHKNKTYHQKRYDPEPSQKNDKGLQNKPQKGNEETCFRCGAQGHWSRTCRTPRHLIDLYQAPTKGKTKIVETNFTNFDDFNISDDFTHLDVSDFLENQDGKSI